MKFNGVLATAAALAIFASTAQAADPVKGEKKVVYELRIYYANPGKMEALHARFRNNTMKLFEKHGMKNVSYWTPTDAKDAEVRLIYVLAHESQEAAAKSWAAFRVDPEWLKVKAESEKDGVLVKKVDVTFMNATDYSPK